MSIEIEVGLENATKAPRVTEEELELEEAPKGLANPNVRRLLFAGGAGGFAGILGLFLFFPKPETPHEAQVDGHITPLGSKIFRRVAQSLVGGKQPVKT